MLKQLAALSLTLAVLATSAFAASGDEKPFKEGAVTNMAYIRVKDGKMFDYMAYLNTTWKPEQEAYKKAGLVTEYHIYAKTPRNPSEANLILTVTHPNLAALDRTDDFEAIDVKLEGSLKAANKGFADRGAIREVLGTELVRELILK